MPTDNGSLGSLSNADLLTMLNGGGAQASSSVAAPATPASNASAPSSAPNQYTAAINSNESSGASDATAGIVNPASGAKGNMQVLPSTAIDPGYGVAPSNGTPQDDARAGRQYYNALNQKYGDPTTAAIAYDMGPGKTDAWLKAGADPSKLPNETLAYALNFNQKTGAAQSPSGQVAPASNAPSGGQDLPGAQFDKFLVTLPKQPAPQDNNVGTLTAIGAGLGRGVQQGVLGAQSLIGRGLNAVGATTAGNWLVNDAAQGNAQGAKDFAANGGNTFAGKAGNVAGQIAPALLMPAEAIPQVAGASVMGAGDASLSNGNIAQGAIGGAAGGALGVAGGHLIGAAAEALSPAAGKLMDALKGGDNAAAANIAKTLKPDEINQVISNLTQNADSPIPGVQRTAAEAADNQTISALQRAAQNAPEGQSAITGRLNANNSARLDAGQNVVGPSANNANMMGPGLEQETDAFTQSQAQRVAQGQQEIAPVTDAQAATMQTPAYQQAINGARRNAANSGISAFADQSDAVNQGLASQIDQVAGTPQSLEQLQNARRAQGTADYAGVSGDIPADTSAFNDLQARPGFNQALNRAAGISDNMSGSAGASALSKGAPTRSLQMGSDGSLNWVETPGATTVDAGILQGARSQLSGMANQAAQAGNAAEAKGYRDTLAAVDGFLGNEQHVGPNIANSFNTARANYSANSVPIDQQNYLQSKLAGAVNNLTGEVNPSALNSTINSVARDQLKPGLRPADRITQPMLDQLQKIGQQARTAPTNMTGLSPQGQELIRQQLTANAAKNPDAQTALAAFNQHLASQSPAYSALNGANQTVAPTLASRQGLSDALAKMSDVANNANGEPNITLAGARRALNNANLTGQQADFAKSLLADLQRSTTANASTGAAGSQTAANLAMQGGGGLIGKLANGSLLNSMLEGGEAGGKVGAIAMGAGQMLMGHAARAAQEKTVKSTIDLLMDPKKLATALKPYASNPNAAKAFIDGLKAKAATGGKAGAVAVQTFNAATQ